MPLSHVQLFVILWTVASQAPLSMEFSRQEYWSGLPLLSPGDLPNPGIRPGSPTLQADSLLSEPPGMPGEGKSQGHDKETSKCEDWSRQRGDWAERLFARQKKQHQPGPELSGGESANA